MFEANLVRIRTHHNKIHRFRDLLRTELSDFDREFIKKRMADEQTALGAIMTNAFPVTFPSLKEFSSFWSIRVVS